MEINDPEIFGNEIREAVTELEKASLISMSYGNMFDKNRVWYNACQKLKEQRQPSERIEIINQVVDNELADALDYMEANHDHDEMRELHTPVSSALTHLKNALEQVRVVEDGKTGEIEDGEPIADGGQVFGDITPGANQLRKIINERLNKLDS